jgi:hypothetical protein
LIHHSGSDHSDLVHTGLMTEVDDFGHSRNGQMGLRRKHKSFPEDQAFGCSFLVAGRSQIPQLTENEQSVSVVP